MRYTKEYVEGLAEKSLLPLWDGMRGRSVLVTGSHGLIGSSIADTLIALNRRYDFGLEILLAARDEAALRQRLSFWNDEDYSFVQYDALDRAFQFPDVDFIVHCASNANPRAYANYPVETMRINLEGTTTLLERTRFSSGTRFLYISSSEVYGAKASDGPFEETDYGYSDILDPRSCYPSSKRACETLCASYADEYGVDALIARPGYIYGPTQTSGDTRAHAQFSRMAANGDEIVMRSAGVQKRSYCYSSDCASALITVLCKGQTGNAYNVGNPESVVSIRRFAEVAAAAGGVSVRFESACESEAKGFNKMPHSVLDCSRLLSLGWRGAYSLERGVSETVECLR